MAETAPKHPPRVRFLHNVLKGLDLPVEKLLVAGSTPLYAAGIIEGHIPRDLDIVVKDGKTWTKLQKYGQAEAIRSQGFQGIRIKYDFDGDGLEDIDFTNSWPMAGRHVRELFRDAMEIDGVLYMSMRDVIVSKRILDREKDRAHLALIEAWYKAASQDLPNAVKSYKGPLSRRDFDKMFKSVEEGLSAKLPSGGPLHNL